MGETQELLQTARELLDKGDLKKAFSTFDKVVKADPQNADGHFGKAEAALGLPKYSIIDIAQFYRDAIKNDPENGYYYLTYGDFCLTNGLLKQAEENYVKAVELDPDNSVFYYNDLGYGYYNYGIMFLDRQLDMSHDDVIRNALRYLLKAYGLDEKLGLAYLEELSSTDSRTLVEPIRKKKEDELQKLKALDDSKEYEKQTTSEPDNPYNYLTYGQFCFTNGLLNPGEANFLKAIKIDPQNRFAYYNDLAANYFLCGIENYEKDLKDVITKNSLRYALRSIELSLDQAIKHLKT